MRSRFRGGEAVDLTAQAAVLVGTGRPLRLMTLEIPVLKPGQVLVEVAYSGVCGSQLNEVSGRLDPDPYLPHTLGHEGSGTVAAVGDGVRKVKPGDRVVLSWIKGRGAEVTATVYGGPDGPVNSGAIGTFMTRTVTCESRVTAIPGEMPLREAALLGCAIATGGGIVRNIARLRPGWSVAVFGVGGIGGSAVAVAAMVGASPIVAVDIVKHKLKHARDLGATHTVNADSRDSLQAVAEITGGVGVDLSIEAAGRPEVMETAFRAVREGGGLCVLAGNLAVGERITIDPFDLIKGKKLVGTWGGETEPDRDIPAYAHLFLEGKLPLSRLITHEYDLRDANTALDDLRRGRVGRAVIAMGPSPSE